MKNFLGTASDMDLDALKSELEGKRKAVREVLEKQQTKYIKVSELKSQIAESTVPDQVGGDQEKYFDHPETKPSIRTNGEVGTIINEGANTLCEITTRDDKVNLNEKVDIAVAEVRDAQLLESFVESLPESSVHEQQPLKLSLKERKELERFKLLSEPIESTPLINADQLKVHRKETLSLLILYIKRLIHHWELYILEEQTDEWRESKEGQQSLQVCEMTRENLKPFFQLLKQDKIPDDVLRYLLQICAAMQQREYVRANDLYLRLAIGNAPWPIGVTMVGIHERSAHEKINSNQVAHVLNDETQRKWIQSIKRLMTFCQTILPPSLSSKAIG